jgi:hypothetical protein
MAMMNELEDNSVSEFIAVKSDRRVTCDPSDVLAMMEDLDDDVDKSCSIVGNRRLTADPADMAAIMAGLEEGERDENSLLKNDSICSSVYSVSSPLGRGRESLDTVALVQSVGKMLRDMDDAEEIEREISVLSRRISSIGAKSSTKKATPKMNIEITRDQGNRRLTADPADMAAIMEGLIEDEREENANSTNDSICSSVYSVSSPLGRGRESLDTVALVQSVGKILRDIDEGEISALSGPFSSGGERSSTKKSASRRKSVCEEDLSMSLSCSTNSDSDQTMGTLDLIANIQSAIDTQDDGDDDTIMTSSSFGSIGGLLNMVAQVERQDRTAPVPAPVPAGHKAAAAVTQSPRRSSRLSVLPDSAGSAQAPFLSTPSNRPSPSRKGLRSCLSSRTKAVVPLSAHSPTAMAKRNVVFGSPKVAEFNKTSPATNMTPMRKEVASRMFSMTLKEGEEEKADNSDEWDRLTNTSGGSPNQSEDEMSPLPVPGSPAFNKRYYASDPDSPASIVAEYSSVRRSPRKKSISSTSSRQSSAECDISMTSQATGTVDLPKSLSELVATVECVKNKNKKNEKAFVAPKVVRQAAVTMSTDVSCSSRDDQTEELEVDLHSLIHSNRMDCPMSDVDESRDQDQDLSGSSVLMKGVDVSQSSDTSSVPSLGPLLGLYPSQGSGAYSTVGAGSRGGENSNYSPVADGLTDTLAPSAESPVKQADVSTASWDDNTSQICAAANTSVDGEGLTVELEVGLQDLMDVMGSPAPVGKKMKGKKTKKRKPLRTATPSLKYAAVEVTSEVTSPWVGDMSVISAVDDDRTERLEGNLGDLMSGVASPSQCDERDSSLWPQDQEQEQANCPGSQEMMEPDRSINLSTASTKSVGSADLRQSMNEEDDVVTLQQGLRSSDIDYLNLVSGPAGESFNFADVSVLSTLDRSMDTSTAHNRLSSVEGMNMMRRLSALNAGARLNSLEQCGTPLAAKGSMSIGMKRHSLSVTRHMAQSSSKRSRASVSGPSPCPLAPRPTFLSSLRPSALSEDLESTPHSIAPAVSEPLEVTAEVEVAAAEPCRTQSPPYPYQDTTMMSTTNEVQQGPYSSPSSSSVIPEEGNPHSEPESSHVEVAAEESVIQCGERESKVEAESDMCPLADDTDETEEQATQEDQEECTIQEIEVESVPMPVEDATAAAVADSARLEAERALEQSVREATATALLLSKRRERANMAGRVQLKALQTQLKAAREQLDRSAEELRVLQKEIFVIQESKKDFMVSLVEQREAADRDSTILQEKERAEASLAEFKAAAEIQAAEKEYLAVKQGVGLLNRLTHCKVLSYQSTCIEVEAVLSPNLRVQVLFTLSMDKTNGVLSVDGTHVDLKYVTDSSPSGRIHNSETALASAYFTDILCSEKVQGPLSEGYLSLVAYPADIPAAMQRVSALSVVWCCVVWHIDTYLSTVDPCLFYSMLSISPPMILNPMPLNDCHLLRASHPLSFYHMQISGFISAFRRSSTWLQCFSTRGWVWAMEGVNVTITAPTGHVLTVPLRAVVCGDVQSVQEAALRDRNGIVVSTICPSIGLSMLLVSTLPRCTLHQIPVIHRDILMDCFQILTLPSSLCLGVQRGNEEFCCHNSAAVFLALRVLPLWAAHAGHGEVLSAELIAVIYNLLPAF